MKPILAVSSILGLALAGIASRAPAVAGDDYVKPAPSQHDVAVRMRVRSQKGTSVRAQLVVQNKGRKSESQVVVSVFADAPVGTPLWTGTMAQLKAHRKRTTKAEFEVPAGTGALVAVYRHINDNVKVGVGYSFTDFSDDLTDQSYSSRGVFVNLVSKF